MLAKATVEARTSEPRHLTPAPTFAIEQASEWGRGESSMPVGCCESNAGLAIPRHRRFCAMTETPGKPGRQGNAELETAEPGLPSRMELSVRVRSSTPWTSWCSNVLERLPGVRIADIFDSTARG